MKSHPTNQKMRTVFHTIAWSLLFICVFCIGCEQQAVTETGAEMPQTEPDEPKTPIVTETVEPDAPVVLEPKVAEPTAPAETTAEPAGSDVAVTVNGVDILESKVAEKIKPRLDRLSSQGATLPDAYVQRIKQQTVEGMIVELLMDQKIKEADITVTDEDVITHLEESGAAQKPPLSLDDIKAVIEAQGQTFEEVKENIKKGLTYQKFMEAHFAEELNITEEDAQKYYSENTARFKVPEQVNASHIIIKIDTSDPDTDPNDANAEAKAKAQDLLEKIKAGADNDELDKANTD